MRITASKAAKAMENLAASKNYEVNTLPELENILEEKGFQVLVEMNLDGKISHALWMAFYEKHTELF